MNYSSFEDEYNITAPTVWYSVEGEGQPVQFSVQADYDSAITLYTGDCEALTCVDHNDDSITAASSLFAGVLEDGRVYYLAVHGFDFNQGDFSLETEYIDPVANDFCQQATEVTVGETFVGNSLAATLKDPLVYCGWYVSHITLFMTFLLLTWSMMSLTVMVSLLHRGTNESQAGVWYVLEGTGQEVSMKLNSRDSTPIYASVYSGEDCDTLTCVSEDGTEDPFNSVIWDAMEGETYWIYAFGAMFFEISFDESERPVNNFCEGAIMLEAGDSIAGSTTDTRPSPILDCFSSDSAFEFSQRAVWFSVLGSGGLMEALLRSFSDSTHFVNVYEGSDCDSLTCADAYEYVSVAAVYGLSNDFGVVWESTTNQQYYIAVIEASQDDEFELEVSEVTSPPNDSCESNIVLEVGDRLAGSIRYASQQENIDCGTYLFGVVF